MEIKFTSYFRSPGQDKTWFEGWVSDLEKQNNRIYERISLTTGLGQTHVWGLNTSDKSLEPLVIFPGARTTPLFWDFDRGLDNLGSKFRIYLVETNGLPNLSDGATPDIKTNGYGEWAAEVIDRLGLEKTYVAGASFGGLICMKLCLVNPEKVKAVFLLNPGCLQSFSLSFKNLYYNLLPILAPSKQNIKKFLDKAVFCKPTHQLSEQAEQLIIDYEQFALKRYKDNTQKPYFMVDELKNVHTPTYLLEGTEDLLFPYKTSIENARKYLSGLKEVAEFDRVGHGIETYAPAIKFIGNKVRELSQIATI